MYVYPCVPPRINKVYPRVPLFYFIKVGFKPASNFVLLIVPSRYFCGGSFRFMSWCLKNFCAVGALCMFSYF